MVAISLNQTSPDGPIDADVAVVGAGLAGLFLADRLAKRGLRVVVLESGGEIQADEVHPLNAVEMLEDTYQGAAHGRFRCLGGTSTRWGGALLPYLAADLGPHPCGWHDGWAIPPEALAKYLDNVEGSFAVQTGSYDGDNGTADLLPSFLPRMPKWPAFRKRSTANIFHRAIHNNPKIQIWLDATVTTTQLEDNSVTGVVAQSDAGRRLEVRARNVVIAAGAIEATRLLLLLDRAAGGKVFPANTPLGKGFHDHLSTKIADLEVTDRKAIARLFSFRFVKGGMRNLRFELSPETRVRNTLPGAFLHVAFSRGKETGFDGLRKVLQAVQKRALPVPADISPIFKDARWFAGAIWWRFFERRVLPPTGSTFELHLVTEQEPAECNWIGLSEFKVDPFDQPIATISWAVRDRDQDVFWQIAEHTFKTWKTGKISALATLRPRDRQAILKSIRDGGGIYHPAGTTRIGPDSSKGVVDDRLRVHGVLGLRVLATSIFPSVGGSSPSLALTQYAVRMADDIATSHDKLA